MTNLKKKKIFLNKSTLYKVFIAIVTITIVVYFMPREGKFNYQFSLDKPWKYGLLTAPFDFPIYKKNDIIKKEQDSILKNFAPYFKKNSSTERIIIKKLRKDYNTSLKSSLPNSKYINHIENTLRDIYKQGIIANDAYEELVKNKNTRIKIILNKQAKEFNLSEIFTAKNAYEYLLQKDTLNYKVEYLKKCNLNDYIFSNLSYEYSKSSSAKKELLEKYSWANGVVQTGQKIIDRGEIINAKTFNILESLKNESEKKGESATQEKMILLGQILYVSVLVLCLILYLNLYRRNYFKHRRTVALVCTLLIFFSVLTEFIVNTQLISVYLLPFTMLPIIIRVFLDSRTAFIVHTITILICSITLNYPFEFIILQLTAGLIAIYSLRELSERSQLFKTVFYITSTYFIISFAFELINESNLSKINWSMYINFIINGILLLFIYPLLFLIEKTFGFISNVTLVELSNTNNSLLKEMSEKVPGTFQHSMQVANLASEAANDISANSQLVRTGALYHDIGKMRNPVFFTENQSGINPHEKLKYEESAKIVISHVTDGIKLAEKYNLPKVIKEFITTHHGEGKTKFFYISWKNEHKDKEIDEKTFTYPGPNPFTKEQAILMMADSVEAASRSLKEYTDKSINDLVESIIEEQVNDGFFKECPLTFKDIAKIKGSFKEKLKIIYHTRISYPKLKNK